MIAASEKRRFLQGLRALVETVNAKRIAEGHMTPAEAAYRTNLMKAIEEDYGDEDAEVLEIRTSKPWFEARIAEGKKIDDMARELGVERHRIVYALNTLGLEA